MTGAGGGAQELQVQGELVLQEVKEKGLTPKQWLVWDSHGRKCFPKKTVMKINIPN